MCSSVCLHIFRNMGLKESEEMKIHLQIYLRAIFESVALMAQNDIMNVVRELGVNELGILL